MTDLVPLNDLERMAQAMAGSGLFGVKTPQQALALMLISHAEGRHPALAAKDYDIIQGKPAKKADAMLRDFLSAGGKVEWHTLNDTLADATFSHPQGGTFRCDWDMKRAATAGFAGKDNWKKFPRAMLRSRVVSEGVRTVFPMATSGMYVPEEVADFTPSEPRDVTPEKPKRVTVDPLATQSTSDMAAAIVGMPPVTTSAVPPAAPPSNGKPAPHLPFYVGHNVMRATSAPEWVGIMEDQFSHGNTDDLWTLWQANNALFTGIKAKAIARAGKASVADKPDAEAFVARMTALEDQMTELNRAQGAGT